MALAIRTGIAPAVWMAEPPAIIATAIELLDEEDEGGE